MNDAPDPEAAQRFYDLYRATGLSVRELCGALGMKGRHADSHLREMLDGVRRVPGPTMLAVEALADGWRPGRLTERDDD